MLKAKLSVTIITLNEEKNLPSCIASVRKLADEIIIVDSGSTDRTIEIARKHGAKIYYRKFDNYANQKNFALKLASGKWILSLDADEQIEPELGDEIHSILTDHESSFIAYTIPRKNIIFRKFIKYTRWQPELDRHIWLWKKNNGMWIGDVHEEVEVNGNVGKLINAKIHYQYNTVSEFLEMTNSYSELESSEKVKRKVKYSFARMIINPIYNFGVRYIYRLGFLDGWRGFVLSYLMAIYHLELWVKVWEKERRR